MVISDHTIEAYPRKLKYPGSFHPNVSKKFKQIIEDKFCVHLFSGSSLLGDVRVDFDHLNATVNDDVYYYCRSPQNYPNNRKKILILDPNYSISRKGMKLDRHGIKDSHSGNVLAHSILNFFIAEYKFDEIALLDYCSPKFKNYNEFDFWRVITGGWQNNRTLTYYKKINQALT